MRNQRGLTVIEVLLVLLVISIFVVIGIGALTRSGSRIRFIGEFGFGPFAVKELATPFVTSHLADLEALVGKKFSQRGAVLDSRPKVDGLPMSEASMQLEDFMYRLGLADEQVRAANERLKKARDLAVYWSFLPKPHVNTDSDEHVAPQ